MTYDALLLELWNSFAEWVHLHQGVLGWGTLSVYIIWAIFTIIVCIAHHNVDLKVNWWSAPQIKTFHFLRRFTLSPLSHFLAVVVVWAIAPPVVIIAGIYCGCAWLVKPIKGEGPTKENIEDSTNSEADDSCEPCQELNWSCEGRRVFTHKKDNTRFYSNAKSAAAAAFIVRDQKKSISKAYQRGYDQGTADHGPEKVKPQGAEQ